MKTIIVSTDKSNPQVILTYENSITPDELMETVFTMLEMVAEQANYSVTTSLSEILEAWDK